MLFRLLILILFSSLWATSGNFSASFSEDSRKLQLVAKGKQARIDLEIPKDMEITHKFSNQTDDYYTLTYQFQDFEAANAVVLVIDKKTLKVVWRKKLDSFNVSMPLVQGDFIYFSSYGTVYKYELKTGKPVWQHKGLDKTLDFVGSENITQNGQWIVFSEKVSVNDKTGSVGGVRQ